jgi:glycosyltransferase involved in cell wall biosynthesis
MVKRRDERRPSGQGDQDALCADMIERGRALHLAGDVAAAAVCYRAALAAAPGNADALHLLGMAELARGEPGALARLADAVRAAPTAQHLANYSMALNAAGRHGDAARMARRALALRPDYPEALNNLGIAHANRGRLAEAVASYRAAIALRPDYAEALINLAVTASHLLDLATVEAACRQAFAARPALHPREDGPTGGPTGGPRGAPRVLFVSGDENTPGALYRCHRMSASAAAAEWQADCIGIDALDETALRGTTVVVFWRVQMSAVVCRVIGTARAAGIAVGLDIDDLIIDPDLARSRIIDGIRTLRHDEASVRAYFTSVRAVLEASDFGLASTRALAERMRAPGRPAFVVPNGFDEAAYAAARMAVRRRAAHPPDDVLRIGYAAGTRTHQRDLAAASGALGRFLAGHPQARLVLFRDPRSGEGLVQVAEFPALHAVRDRIEWRDMVPLDALPAELARFDINIAPLELGNPFVDAKSELKFFEAGLVDVPTIASPTRPFAEAIEHGRTGWLAADEQAWLAGLEALAESRTSRRRMGRAAHIEALARFGPLARADAIGRVLEQAAGLRFAAEIARGQLVSRGRAPPARHDAIDVTPFDVLHAQDRLRHADVTIVVPLYNYAGFVEEALQSAHAQTLAELDLIVVDDASRDASAQVAQAWLKRHGARFNRAMLVRHAANAGLAAARNTGFGLAETLFVLPLDADNRLLAECCARLLGALRASHAVFAYPRLQQFGGQDAVVNDKIFSAAGLMSGNYIDAMALIRREAWAAAGGYRHMRLGWEDYDFWCRICARAWSGVAVPEVLAQYRVHESSMLRTVSDIAANRAALVAEMRRLHPWLTLD